MRSDNYTHLQRNTLDGLSETAGCLYLKLLDVFEAHRSTANERSTFLAATDYDDQAGCTLDYIMRRSPANIDVRTRTNLSQFFAERWRHNFMQTSEASNG